MPVSVFSLFLSFAEKEYCRGYTPRYDPAGMITRLGLGKPADVKSDHNPIDVSQIITRQTLSQIITRQMLSQIRTRQMVTRQMLSQIITR